MRSTRFHESQHLDHNASVQKTCSTGASLHASEILGHATNRTVATRVPYVREDMAIARRHGVDEPYWKEARAL